MKLLYIFLIIKFCLTQDEDVKITPSTRSVLISGKLFQNHTEYQLQVKEHYEKVFYNKKIKGPKNNVTIDGLEPCVDYIIDLINYDSHGVFPKNFTTKPELPGHVKNITTFETNEFVTIEWIPPEEAPRCVDYYKGVVTFFEQMKKYEFNSSLTTYELYKENETFKEPTVIIFPVPRYKLNTNKSKIKAKQTAIEKSQRLTIPKSRGLIPDSPDKLYRFLDSKYYKNGIDRIEEMENEFGSLDPRGKRKDTLVSVVANIMTNVVTTELPLPIQKLVLEGMTTSTQEDTTTPSSSLSTDSTILTTTIEFIPPTTTQLTTPSSSLSTDSTILTTTTEFTPTTTTQLTTTLAPPCFDITKPEVKEITPNNALVVWNVVEEKQCRTTKYRVSWKSEGETHTVKETMNTNYLITNLKPCTSYTITVEPIVNENNENLKKTQHSVDLFTFPSNADFEGSPKIDVRTTNISLSWAMKEKCEFKFEVIYRFNKETKIIPDASNSGTIIPDLNPCTIYGILISVSFNNKIIQWEKDLGNYFTYPQANSIHNLRLANITSNGATVLWVAPVNCQIKYVVSWSTTDSHQTKNEETFDTNINLPGLESCTKYRVKVQALRETQKVADDMIKDFSTSPSNANVSETKVEIGVTDVTLSWKMQEKCSFTFVVIVKTNSATLEIPAKFTDNFTVPNLSPCTYYTISIKSILEENSWSQSQVLRSIITYPDDEEISWIEPTEVDSNRIKIWWRRPICNKFQYEYTITVIGDASTGTTPYSHNEYSSPVYNNATQETFTTIPNLNPCTSYFIQVKTKILNVPDWIAESIEDLFRSNITKADIKDKVTLNIVKDMHSLKVSWNLPPNYGDACTSSLEYNITVYDVQTGEDVFRNITPENNQIVTDLEACTNYKIDVTPIYEEEFSKTSSKTCTTLYADPKDLEIYDPKESPGTNKNLFDLTINWMVKNNPNCIASYNFIYKGFDEIISSSNTVNNIMILKDLKLCVDYNFIVETISKENKTGETQNKLYKMKVGPNDPPKLIEPINAPCTDCKTGWRINGNNCPLDTLLISCEIRSSNESEGCKSHKPTSYNLSNHKEGNFSVTLESLSAWTNYSCTAVVNNTEGAISDKSDVFLFETNEKEPMKPEITSIIINDQNDQMRIEWTAPICSRGVLLGYNYTIGFGKPSYAVREECTTPTYPPLRKLTNETNANFDYPSDYHSVDVDVTLTAYTKIGSSETEFKKTLTKPGVPNPPEGINYEFGKCNKNNQIRIINLEWMSPCVKNGIVDQYTIRMIENEKETNTNISAEIENKKEYFHEELNMKPNMEYSFFLFSNNNEANYQSVASEPIIFHSPSGIPIVKNASVSIKEINDKNVTITTEDVFDDTNGDLLYFAIILVNGSGIEEEVKSDFWNCTGNDGIWPENPGQQTPNNWSGPEFTITHLQPNTTYKIKIRGFTSTAYQDTEYITIKTIEILKQEKFDLGLIIGILVAVIVVTSIIAIIYKTKGRMRHFKNWPILSRPRIFGSRSTNVTTSLNGEIKSAIPRPILVTKFVEHYNQMIQNEGRISSEFQMLNTLCADISSSTAQALLPPNRRKNRYINILPYDDNRVHLRLPMSSDYINASYVRGWSGEKEFIAAQGPTETTYPAFWRMVYDEDVKIIIMLTQLVEQNKEKCYKYYPEIMDEITFETDVGEMKVLGLIEETQEVHTLRKIALIENGNRKELVHILFNKWPDFGVPTHVSHILHFHKTVLKLRSENSGMILVHCSAGVGRTGTLIALDILSQAVIRSRKVDIFNTVLNLRKQRVMMVQSEKQYEFLYKCIQQIIIRKDSNKNDRAAVKVKESGM